MPPQQQNSSFAARLGARVAQANAEHKDKPIDTGNRRLPPGIRAGVAKLTSMYTKQQTEEDGKTPMGETFFRASASVIGVKTASGISESFEGEKISGMITSIVIPLCDVPAKGKRKAVSFSEQWYEFQNLFKLLGVAPPPETPQTDPTGQRTEAYYFMAMKALTDPNGPDGKPKPPIYIEFSTRGWKPPKDPGESQEAYDKRDEMVFETWHGLSTWNGKPNPAAGITITNVSAQPDRYSMPPTTGPSTPTPVPALVPAPVFNEFENPPPVAGGQVDIADEVAALVETAMDDPAGNTPDGAAAGARLEELAWGAGWTKEETAGAADWSTVGDMVLNPRHKNPPLPSTGATTPSTNGPPTEDKSYLPGSKHRFRKRDSGGNPLKNSKGEEFAPLDVEIVTSDLTTQTCTVKNIKDGKDVVDIRSKKPVTVKFEWLE